MTKRSAERERFLADIITTAVEGGTGYWAAVSDYSYWHDAIKDDDAKAFAILHEMSQDPDNDEVLPGGTDWAGHYLAEELRLDIDAVASAVGKISRGEARIGNPPDGFDALGDHARKLIAHASIDNDSGDIDADMADIIAQVALLGTVVYG